MRPISIIPLLALLLLLAAVPAAQPVSTSDGELTALREQMRAATDRAAWDEAAERYLAVLDEAGRSESSEAAWLVGRLLESRQDDPALLWRRAEQRRRQPDVRGAIEDLERLARVRPDHPLALRARRRLPALYLHAGMHARSARADEALFEEKLADPVAVLTRLARTYAGLGQLSDTEEALERLAALAPDRARYDAELSWLRVSAIERLGSRERAAAALLDFANLFPWDARRAEALLLAARAHEETGRTKLAIVLADDAIENAREERIASGARLLRATLLERTDRPREARDQYLSLLGTASSPDLVAIAMQRLIHLEVEERGSEAALLMLAGLAERGDLLTRPMARRHVERLLTALAERIADDPASAAFHVALARRLDADLGAAPTVVLAAARLRETLGERDAADTLYRTIDPESVDDVSSRDRVRRAHARRAPASEEHEAGSGDEDLLERLTALQHLGEYEAIQMLVADRIAETEAAHPLPAAARIVGARAALARGNPESVLRLLEPLDERAAGVAVLRGDAQALMGMWEAACVEYGRAQQEHARTTIDSQSTDPRVAAGSSLANWLELRLAACALRRGRHEEGRGRLEALLAAEPGDPVTFAAGDLLHRIDSFPAGPAKPEPSDAEPAS